MNYDILRRKIPREYLLLKFCIGSKQNNSDQYWTIWFLDVVDPETMLLGRCTRCYEETLTPNRMVNKGKTVAVDTTFATQL